MPSPVRLEARAEDALLNAGHTGLGGFAFAGDGSTLFVATATYHGGPTRSVSYALDLRAANARPVRLHEGDDGPTLSTYGASDDGRFVLESRGDGLHRAARDGSSDVLVPNSVGFFGSAALAPDGSSVGFVRAQVLYVVDVASGRTVTTPVGMGSLLMMLDSATVLVGDGAPSGAHVIRRVSAAGTSTEVCGDCSVSHVGREGRIEENDDGTRRLVGSGPDRALGEGLSWAISRSGRVWARVAIVEARQYEYERRLHVEGLARPIDRVLGESIGDLGEVVVGEDGTVVAEAVVRRWSDPRSEWDRQSCLVVLHPSVRVVACEPCDSTFEHCR